MSDVQLWTLKTNGTVADRLPLTGPWEPGVLGVGWLNSDTHVWVLTAHALYQYALHVDAATAAHVHPAPSDPLVAAAVVPGGMVALDQGGGVWYVAMDGQTWEAVTGMEGVVERHDGATWDGVVIMNGIP